MLSGDVVAKVQELRRQDGLDIRLCGTADLTGRLVDEIDELVIKTTYPCFLGSGLPLAVAGFEIREFGLDSVGSFKGGVVITTCSRKRKLAKRWLWRAAGRVCRTGITWTYGHEGRPGRTAPRRAGLPGVQAAGRDGRQAPQGPRSVCPELGSWAVPPGGLPGTGSRGRSRPPTGLEADPERTPRQAESSVSRALRGCPAMTRPLSWRAPGIGQHRELRPDDRSWLSWQPRLSHLWLRSCRRGG